MPPSYAERHRPCCLSGNFRCAAFCGTTRTPPVAPGGDLGLPTCHFHDSLNADVNDCSLRSTRRLAKTVAMTSMREIAPRLFDQRPFAGSGSGPLLRSPRLPTNVESTKVRQTVKVCRSIDPAIGRSRAGYTADAQRHVHCSAFLWLLQTGEGLWHIYQSLCDLSHCIPDRLTTLGSAQHETHVPRHKHAGDLISDGVLRRARRRSRECAESGKRGRLFSDSKSRSRQARSRRVCAQFLH